MTKQQLILKTTSIKSLLLAFTKISKEFKIQSHGNKAIENDKQIGNLNKFLKFYDNAKLIFHTLHDLMSFRINQNSEVKCS